MKKAPDGRFFVLKCKMRRRQKAERKKGGAKEGLGEGRVGRRKGGRRKVGAKEGRSEGRSERKKVGAGKSEKRGGKKEKEGGFDTRKKTGKTEGERGRRFSFSPLAFFGGV